MGELVLDSASRHTGIALQFQRDGRPAYVSYGEFGTISTEIARGLMATGIELGDRVAILGLTSADWTLADCGAQCAGAVVTPIYHTNSPEECAYVLADSGAKLIFCEDATQASKIEQIRDRCPALEHVVLFEGTDGEIETLEDLRRRGAEIRPEAVGERLAEVGEQDLATLVYTSGTTGPPKGCMLSHENLLATARMYGQQLRLADSHSLYQCLTLAHVLARAAAAVRRAAARGRQGTSGVARGPASRRPVRPSVPDRRPARVGQGACPVRSPVADRAGRSRPDRARAVGVLRCLRRARVGGLRADRDLRRGDAQHV